MNAYYNEHDPYAAQWLRNLASAGHIAPGVVDERDIRDVRPSDLDGFAQCHFFAGIGIWSAALRSAGWDDTRPVWTGSCPCQPFSAAGAGAGMDDERHLWPHWHWLIEQCRPETVFGEQVASADGLGWADLVSSDMEATDYAIGFVDTCAAGFRSFHIRQRLYFAADNCRSAPDGWEDVARAFGGLCDTAGPRSLSAPLGGIHRNEEAPGPRHAEPERSGDADRLAYGKSRGCGKLRDALEPGQGRYADGCGQTCSGMADSHGEPQRRGHAEEASATRSATKEAQGKDGQWPRSINVRGGSTCGMANVKVVDRGLSDRQIGQPLPEPIRGCQDVVSNPSDGYWRDADWLYCRDGSWRPVEPGTFPLAHASPARMGRLRAYGNGLDLAQATGFVRAYMERDLANLATDPAGDLFEAAILAR